jgi:hypothetical protein
MVMVRVDGESDFWDESISTGQCFDVSLMEKSNKGIARMVENGLTSLVHTGWACETMTTG